MELFFVLSGFLITSLIIQEHFRTQAVSLARFFFRRALRLLPALIVLLVALALYASSVANETDRAAVYAACLATFFYIADYWHAALGRDLTTYLFHTWSLACEEQFYVLWPPLLVLMLRRRVVLGKIAPYLAGAVGAVVIWRFVIHFSVPFDRIYYALDTQADGLLVGCLLGVLLAAPRWPTTERAVRLTRGAASLAVVLLALSAVWPGSPVVYMNGFSLLSVVCGFALLGLLTTPSGLAARLLAWRPIEWTGRLSYSLYLWHAPVFAFTEPSHIALPRLVVGVIRFVAVFGIAAASYYVVERPFLRLKSRLARVQLPAATEPPATAALTS